MKKILYCLGFISLALLLATAFLFVFYNRPLHRSLFLTPVCKLETEEKVVSLTFDDGPSRLRTPPLIDLLQKHDVKATFFMTGIQMEKNWEIVEKVTAGGHLIGNHSYSHTRLIFKSPSVIEREIDKTDSLIVKSGNTDLTYFRPPYGDKLITLPYLLKSKGKQLVNFDVSCPSQYEVPMNVEKVVQEALNQCRPGSIIILHDGWNRDVEPFISAVDGIITGLKGKGYRFVLLNEKV